MIYPQHRSRDGHFIYLKHSQTGDVPHTHSIGNTAGMIYTQSMSHVADMIYTPSIGHTVSTNTLSIVESRGGYNIYPHTHNIDHTADMTMYSQYASHGGHLYLQNGLPSGHITRRVYQVTTV